MGRLGFGVFALQAWGLVFVAGCSGLGASAGGGDGGAGNMGGKTPLPCDVDAVLAANCRACHADPPLHGAPMPLVSREDLFAPSRSDSSKPTYAMVEQRIHDDASPMPQPPNARLSVADSKTLDDWIANGAPAASTACATAEAGTSTPASATLSCDVTSHGAAAQSWTMPSDTQDIYMCFGFDVSTASKRHVIAITPRIDNQVIVHHLVLFQSDKSENPVPTACNLGGAAEWRAVYGWAPGTQPLELPAEAGFAQEAGTTHYVAQIHYSNPNHLSGQQDLSGFDLCETDTLRPNDADVLGFGSMSFTIEPHSSLDMTCNYAMPAWVGNLHAFSAMLHMHRLGTAIGISDVPASGGDATSWANEDHWDFESQPWRPFQGSMNARDTVSIRCAYNNPTDTAVSFGTATKDEMCLSLVAYYPKIMSNNWSWILPSLESSCAATP